MNGLKEKRIAKGMTQTELANAVGVSQTVISMLEREDVEAGEELGAAIEHALDTKMVWRWSTPKENVGTKVSQTQRVLDYMRQHGSISQQEAIKAFSCYRLAAKIFELRRDKHIIKTERVPFRNEYTSGFYAVYRLVGEDQ